MTQEVILCFIYLVSNPFLYERFPRSLLLLINHCIAVNCLWAEWQEDWSPCNATCGEGKRSKIRLKVQERSDNPLGEECIGSGYQLKPCIEKPCPGILKDIQ